MELFKCYRMKIEFIVFIAAIMFSGSTRADFTFGEVINPGAPINSTSGESPVCLSPDGLEMYFISDRPGGLGDVDIWVTKRIAIDANWASPENLGPEINSPEPEMSAVISSDGLTLYFSSKRAGGFGWLDLWKSTRTHKNDPWTSPVNLGPIVNSEVSDYAASISADGLEMYFNSPRPGGLGGWFGDIWLTTRTSTEEPWAEPVNASALNSSDSEVFTCLSSDGRALFLDSDRPGGSGDFDIWLSRRQTSQDAWSTPTNLGSTINSPDFDGLGALAPDGRTLYFGSTRPGGLGGWFGDIWQAPIIPIVDFNGDGNIDTDDILLMMDNWGTDESLCDIGPMPWGDGVVDMEDLTVFIEYWESENFINVDEDDNGSKVSLKQGQRLVVTLESNPSTGYRWELVENQNSILEQIGESEFILPEQTDPPMVGVPGWEVFRFEAKSAGQQTLELLYRRSWEEGVEPAKTFSIDVIVN